MESADSKNAKSRQKPVRKARFIYAPWQYMPNMMLPERPIMIQEQPVSLKPQNKPKVVDTANMKHSISEPNLMLNFDLPKIEKVDTTQRTNPPGNFDIISRGNLPSISFVHGNVIVEPPPAHSDIAAAFN